jgi:tetratricopeptide (TPR) repeat protein
MKSHVDDEELSLYALAPSLCDEREPIEQHVSLCTACRERLQLNEEIESAFRDSDVWAAVDQFLTRSARLEAARAEYLRIEKDDADAEALLEPLLKTLSRFRGADIDADSRFHTAAVVRKLCLAAHARHEKQPQFSLLITNAACRIALQLPKGRRERRLVLALAIRERANALRYLGRFAQGLKSLDDAEKLFDQSPGTDPFDLAIVGYIRATIYMKCERLSEGAELARNAAFAFHEYGDSLRELSAIMAEACCLALAGEPFRAVAAFERVITIARSTGEREMLARALQNAGVSYLSAGEPSKAVRCLLEAMAIFDEIGLATERARSMWKLATVLATEGKLAESARQLDQARAELLRLGLVNDAALATLEWAEVQLALSQPEGVADACSSIVIQFEVEGMRRNASLALAYLHETLRSGSATPSIVREVRAFLTELPNRPEIPFERPLGKSAPGVS